MNATKNALNVNDSLFFNFLFPVSRIIKDIDIYILLVIALSSLLFFFFGNEEEFSLRKFSGVVTSA